MHPSWYCTLCLGTGATARYRMHLCILAGMVHCVLVQVLLLVRYTVSWYRCCCWYGTLCLGAGATARYRMHLCILAGMVHWVLVQVLHARYRMHLCILAGMVHCALGTGATA